MRFISVRFLPLIIRLLKAPVKNIFYSFKILALIVQSLGFKRCTGLTAYPGKQNLDDNHSLTHSKAIVR